MRLSTVPLPLFLASASVLAHGGARHHLARHHDRLAKRGIDMMEKRQRPAVSSTLATQSTSDNSDDGGTTSGTTSPLSSTAENTTRSSVASVTSTPVVSTISPVTSSTTQSILSSSSVVPTATITSSSAVSSTSTFSSAAVPSSSTSIASSIISSASSSSAVAVPTSSVSSAEASTSTSHENVVTVTTDPAGEVRVITTVLTASPTASADTVDSPSDTEVKSDGGGISTGAIIGISVAAGVVLFSLIGCAIWRMKRRGGDEDEAIRWPELNRHGDSDTHHALPARQTGHHGFETGLERSLSNSSSIFTPSAHVGALSAHSPPAMALNGSNFGAASSLEDYDDYDEKSISPLPALPAHAHVASHPGQPTSPYDIEDDYTNMPPPVQMHQNPNFNTYGGYDSEEEGRMHGHGQQMGMMPGAPSPIFYSHGH